MNSTTTTTPFGKKRWAGGTCKLGRGSWIKRILCKHKSLEAWKSDTSKIKKDLVQEEREALYIECTGCGRRWRIPGVFKKTIRKVEPLTRNHD